MDVFDDGLPAMPALEWACYFASWSSVGKRWDLSRPWLKYVLRLATHQKGENQRTKYRRALA
jgi:hypothetical protein